jgi:hypothetical protein
MAKNKQAMTQGIEPPLLGVPEESMRYFDCDQQYALTGVLPLDKYRTRLEAAENGHFACVKMMDEKGIDVPRSTTKHLTDNFNILITAWKQGNLDFVDWALNRSGDRHYVLPPHTWHDLADAHDYRTLASAISNYGKWTTKQIKRYPMLTIWTLNPHSYIMKKAVADLPQSGGFLFWIVSPKMNPEMYSKFAANPDWIDVMVEQGWYERIHLGDIPMPVRRNILSRMLYLVRTSSPGQYSELRAFLKAHKRWMPKDIRDKLWFSL